MDPESKEKDAYASIAMLFFLAVDESGRFGINGPSWRAALHYSSVVSRCASDETGKTEPRNEPGGKGNAGRAVWQRDEENAL